MLWKKKSKLLAMVISATSVVSCTESNVGADAKSAANSLSMRSLAIKAQNLEDQYKDAQGFNYIDPSSGSRYIGISYKDKEGKDSVEVGVPLPTLPEDEISAPTAYAFAVDGTLLVGFGNGNIYQYNLDENGQHKDLPKLLVSGDKICAHDNKSGKNICNLPITSMSILAYGDVALQYVAIGTGVNKVTLTDKQMTTSFGYFVPGDPRNVSLSLNLNWINTTETISYGGQVYYYYAGDGNLKEQLVWSNSGNAGQAVSSVVAVPGDSGYNGTFNPYAFITYEPNPVVSSKITSVATISMPFSGLKDPLDFLTSLIPAVSYSKTEETTSDGYDFGVVSLSRLSGVSRLSCFMGSNNSVTACANSSPGKFENLTTSLIDFNHGRMYLGLDDGRVVVWSFVGTLPNNTPLLKSDIDIGSSSFFTLATDPENSGRIPTAFQLDGDDLLVGWSSPFDVTVQHNDVVYYKDVTHKSPDLRGSGGDLPMLGHLVYRVHNINPDDTNHIGKIVAIDFHKTKAGVGVAAIGTNIPQGDQSKKGWDQGRSGAVFFARDVNYDDDNYDYTKTKWGDIHLIPAPKLVRVGTAKDEGLVLAYTSPNYNKGENKPQEVIYPTPTVDDSLNYVMFNKSNLQYPIKAGMLQLHNIIPEVKLCGTKPMILDTNVGLAQGSVYFGQSSKYLGTVAGGGVEVNNYQDISFIEDGLGNVERVVITPTIAVLKGEGVSAQYHLPKIMAYIDNPQEVSYDGMATMMARRVFAGGYSELNICK